MTGLTHRHVVGAVFGGLAASAIVLTFASFYSFVTGLGPLDPYQGIGELFNLTGPAGAAVGIMVDLIIPMVASFVFLAVLDILSSTTIKWLELTSLKRAAGEGLALGATVWAVFYVPVLYLLLQPPTSSLILSLTTGLIDHLIFGAAIVTVIFTIGGPVKFAERKKHRS